MLSAFLMWLCGLYFLVNVASVPSHHITLQFNFGFESFHISGNSESIESLENINKGWVVCCYFVWEKKVVANEREKKEYCRRSYLMAIGSSTSY